MVCACCNHLSGVFIEQASSGKDFWDFLGAIGPTAIGMAGLWMAFAGIVKPIRANRIQNRITQLEARLNNFYGPYFHLRRKSALLYDKLKQPYLAESGFSVLRKIFSGHKFIGNDALLIKEIIAIGEQCEELIAKNSGYIDAGSLRDDLLPSVSIHYRILKLAFDGTITADLARFGDMTFPIAIDDALRSAIKAIEDEKKQLEDKLMKAN